MADVSNETELDANDVRNADAPYIERWDNGSELLLLGYAGGAHEDGALAFLDTVMVEADGSEKRIRFIRADRVGLSLDGEDLS